MPFLPEEIKEFESELNLLVKKLGHLREAYVLEDDPSRKFKLEVQIGELEGRVHILKKRIAESFSIRTDTGQSLLAEAISELQFDEEEEIGLIHLVNCDRSEKVNLFWRLFDELEEAPFQYFFIAACKTESPHSFSERMVYELIIEELEESESAIHCIRHADSQRLKIENLPLRRNLEKSKKEFKEYVQNRFQFADSQSFESFIKTGVPKLPYEYVTVVFEINESIWKDHIQNYINWMMDTFQTSHEKVPTFLFFFVVDIDRLHLPGSLSAKQLQIKSAIEKLTEHPSAKLLSPLFPVLESDLENWLYLLEKENNLNQIRKVISLLVNGLQPEEKALYQKEKRLHMKDVEVVQRLVYEIANK